MNDTPNPSIPSNSSPSGQVAEDRAVVFAGLRDDATAGMILKADEALDHLAAKAQGYEAMKAERDAAVADNAALFALGERLYAMAQHDEACKMLVGSEFAMCDCAMGEWQQVQRDTANDRHPGAALLAEHAKALMRARNEGLEKAAHETDAEADEWDAAAAHDGDAVSHEANAIRGASRRARAKKEPES